MTKVYFIGIIILLTAILANTIANYININTWHSFYHTILEKESIVKALKEQTIFDVLWLIFLYPLILGCGYLIANKLLNIFS